MVEYLGFIMSPEGLHMDLVKVLMIQAWLVPCNFCKVQSFLGFAHLHQCFISSYMEFTQPLTNLCQKNTPWHFGEPESTAFQHLKMAFHAALVLYHWALDLPMTVETDASDYAIVGILSITTPDLEICLIAFHSVMVRPPFFPFMSLSVPHPISTTFRPHPTSSACLLPPLLQLQGVLMQLCYIHAQTSLGLTLDLLGPDPHAKGHCLYTSYNLSDPFFIINNG